MVLFRKLILYIATSLDGYIAREDGNIDWLSIVEDKNEDYGYKKFLSSIDTVIMGRKTYDMVLSFGEFPYPDKKCFVVTRTERPPDRWVNFWSKDVSELLSTIRRKDGLNIWLVGRGELIHEFIHEFSTKNLIDEYIVSIIPIILGSGIPLFRSGEPEVRLGLLGSSVFPSGLIQLIYKQEG